MGIIALCTIVGLLFLFVLFFIAKFLAKNKVKKLKIKAKEARKENAFLAVDELRKILKLKPDDQVTRKKLVDVLFEIQMYLPAIRECMLLVDASASNKEVDELTYTRKIGEGYFLLKNYVEAKKYFLIAKKISNIDFLSNFYLGKIEYENENYEKALLYLNEAVKADPENLESLRLKGVAAFLHGSYRESILAMTKVAAANSSDQEVLYYLGMGLFRVNKFPDAVKVFNQIRTVPQYKIEVEYCLATIYKKSGEHGRAIEILNELLKSVETDHALKIPEKKLLDIYYLQGECFANLHDTSKALHSFQECAKIHSSYRDVQQRIELYSQLTTNVLLERFLVGSVNDYTSLCKMFVKYYIMKFSHIKGNIKFFSAEINLKGEMEIRAEVSSSKFVIVVYFIFFRSNSTIGDFTVRNIYNMLKDEKIDKGVCVTAGNFSETAMNYIESRMLETVDKNQLAEILKGMEPYVQGKAGL